MTSTRFSKRKLVRLSKFASMVVVDNETQPLIKRDHFHLMSATTHTVNCNKALGENVPIYIFVYFCGLISKSPSQEFMMLLVRTLSFVIFYPVDGANKMNRKPFGICWNEMVRDV